MTPPNLRFYKIAKIAVREMPGVIVKMEAALTMLKPYSKYFPVKAIIKQLDVEIKIMKKSLAKMQKVYAAKGGI